MNSRNEDNRVIANRLANIFGSTVAQMDSSEPVNSDWKYLNDFDNNEQLSAKSGKSGDNRTEINQISSEELTPLVAVATPLEMDYKRMMNESVNKGLFSKGVENDDSLASLNKMVGYLDIIRQDMAEIKKPTYKQQYDSLKNDHGVYTEVEELMKEKFSVPFGGQTHEITFDKLPRYLNDQIQAAKNAKLDSGMIEKLEIEKKVAEDCLKIFHDPRTTNEKRIDAVINCLIALSDAASLLMKVVVGLVAGGIVLGAGAVAVGVGITAVGLAATVAIAAATIGLVGLIATTLYKKGALGLTHGIQACVEACVERTHKNSFKQAMNHMEGQVKGLDAVKHENKKDNNRLLEDENSEILFNAIKATIVYDETDEDKFRSDISNYLSLDYTREVLLERDRLTVETIPVNELYESEMRKDHSVSKIKGLYEKKQDKQPTPTLKDKNTLLAKERKKIIKARSELEKMMVRLSSEEPLSKSELYTCKRVWEELTKDIAAITNTLNSTRQELRNVSLSVHDVVSKAKAQIKASKEVPLHEAGDDNSFDDFQL